MIKCRPYTVCILGFQRQRNGDIIIRQIQLPFHAHCQDRWYERPGRTCAFALDPLYIPQFIASRLSHATGHRIASKLPRHAKIITAKEMLPQEYFDRLFKFTFVHNPGTCRSVPGTTLAGEDPTSWHTSVISMALSVGNLIPNDLTSTIWTLPSNVRRTTCKDLDRTVLADFIGKYENLLGDYQEACRWIGINPPPLPHKGQGQDREDHRTYYDEDLAKLAAPYCREDIERFGYAFE